MKRAARMSSEYFKTRAEQLGLGPEDISFQLAKLDVQVTGQAVRYWLAGANCPNIALADPLAKVLKTDRQTILAAMHAIAEARVAAATGKE